jgi:hypothetical protein
MLSGTDVQCFWLITGLMCLILFDEILNPRLARSKAPFLDSTSIDLIGLATVNGERLVV